MARYYEDARKLAYMLTKWSTSIPSKRIASCDVCAVRGSWRRPTWAPLKPGQDVGLNIRLPYEQMPNPYITPASISSSLLLHAQVLVRLSGEGAVVFPGGFGTLDELFELLTLAQTGKLAKKIVSLCTS